MIPCRLMMTILILFITIGAPEAVTAEAPLTDEAKKKIVYRMYDGYTSDFPDVADISVRKAMTLSEAGEAVFVDVRKPAEMAVSMLPGAVTETRFLENPTRYAGKTVIAYCTISYRSGVFAKEMAQKGVTVKNLKGGLLAWVLEGGKVYHDGEETRRIHVYGDKWDYPPDGYESVVFHWWEKAF